MRAGLGFALALALAADIAHAGPRTPAPAPGGRVLGKVTVTDADGKAVDAEAIIYVVGFTEPPAPGARAVIAQKSRKFVPDLVAITVGELVSFPNEDTVLHNVFSQSSARQFDLGSFKKGDAKEKDFPKPGVVDIYCNIHPEMAATILVLPNQRHTRRKPDGTYAIEGVPPGDWTVFAYTRRATKPARARVHVEAGKDTTVDFALVRGAEPEHLNKFGEKYRKDGQTAYP